MFGCSAKDAMAYPSVGVVISSQVARARIRRAHRLCDSRSSGNLIIGSGRGRGREPDRMPNFSRGFRAGPARDITLARGETPLAPGAGLQRAGIRSPTLSRRAARPVLLSVHEALDRGAGATRDPRRALPGAPQDHRRPSSSPTAQLAPLADLRGPGWTVPMGVRIRASVWAHLRLAEALRCHQ